VLIKGVVMVGWTVTLASAMLNSHVGSGISYIGPQWMPVVRRDYLTSQQFDSLEDKYILTSALIVHFSWPNISTYTQD
jgi:hypothetical protein